MVARGAVRVSHAEPRDQIVLRLIAALAAASDAPARPDAALVAALDDIVAAYVMDAGGEMHVGPDAGAPAADETSLIRSPTEAPSVDQVLAAARAHGPAALALLHALAAEADSGTHVGAPYAGLYLLVRPIADLRLDQLARRAGVSFADLLAALAVKLLGAAPPWDAAMRLWFGAAGADPSALEPASLRTLQPLVLRALAGLRYLPAAEMAIHRFTWRDEPFVALSDAGGSCWPLAARADDGAETALVAEWHDAGAEDAARVSTERAPTADLAELAAADALSPEVDVLVTAIATCVVRAMSRWLPGLSASSAPFLVRNCLRRAGAVEVTAREITVTLERAALDAVLEMASSFAPVPETTWLGRRVRFTVVATPR